MKITLKPFLVLYLLQLTFLLTAQAPFYVNFNTNDGLPSSEVYQMHCDEIS